MIREAPTTSSSESIFTDPENDDVDKTINLTITKLQQLNLISNQPSLQVVHQEHVNFEGKSSESSDEMPIVKKNSENGQQENGTDKGIFSVSRVKKVELPEIPLATDICSAARKLPLEVLMRRNEFSHIFLVTRKFILLRDLLHVMFQH